MFFEDCVIVKDTGETPEAEKVTTFVRSVYPAFASEDTETVWLPSDAVAEKYNLSLVPSPQAISCE